VRRIVAVVAAVVLAGFSSFPSLGAVGATSIRTALAGQVPTVVSQGTAQRLGPLPAQKQLQLAVGLRIRDWAALNRVLVEETTPGSARYGHYLTQAQANRLYNPTVEQQNEVVRWLDSQGLRVMQTFSNHLLISATGSTAVVERAFGVSLYRYRAPLFGRAPTSFYAPASAPSLPAALNEID